MSSLTSSISYQALSCSLCSPVTDCPLIPNCKPTFSISSKPNVLYYSVTTSAVKKILALLSKEFALCLTPPPSLDFHVDLKYNLSLWGFLPISVALGCNHNFLVMRNYFLTCNYKRIKIRSMSVHSLNLS